MILVRTQLSEASENQEMSSLRTSKLEYEAKKVKLPFVGEGDGIVSKTWLASSSILSDDLYKPLLKDKLSRSDTHTQPEKGKKG